VRFVPSPEQTEFAVALADLLDDANTPSIIRCWSAGDAGPGRKLWSRLADLGLWELAADPVGRVLAFEELGRAGAPGPYVESAAVRAAELPELEPDAMATLALPPHVPYAVDADVADVVYLLDGETLAAATVGARVESVDKARRLARAQPAHMVGVVDAARVLDVGALATAAYVHGAGAALLSRATGYARQRHQFGRPIGSFQAVKHQLADVAVALDLARPLLFGAALALDTATAARDVSAAKVACTDAAYRAARTALQVHGAIGYTAEYDLGLWLTKVRALVSAWGTQRFHRQRVLAAIR
jgi:alkylation response protein AidB-like acyl-CoA dehydrogenase